MLVLSTLILKLYRFDFYFFFFLLAGEVVFHFVKELVDFLLIFTLKRLKL